MRILVLTSRFPYPLEKGDKLRIFCQMRELAKSHEVILCAICEALPTAKNFKAVANAVQEVHCLQLPKWRSAMNLCRGFFNKLPFQVNYYFDGQVQKELLRIIDQTQPDHLYCQLPRTAEYIRQSQLPKTIDYQDAFSVIAKRWAANSVFPKNMLLSQESRRMQYYEQLIFDDFNHHTLISEQDRALMPMPQKERIHIIPNGVDIDFFQPNPTVEKKYDICFVGNMGYPPNVNAAQFLVKKIMPLLMPEYPELKILIAGARPSKEVQALASKQVVVTGWLEDIRLAYAESHIFVAPIFMGAGLQNKVLESMAMGTPRIVTSQVNNAIGGVEGTTIMVADTAEAFAAKIKMLLKSESLKTKLAVEGLNFVKKQFSWQETSNKLARIMQSPLTK